MRPVDAQRIAHRAAAICGMLAAWLLAGACSPAPSPGADGPPTALLTYRGRLADDPRLAEVGREFAAALRAATAIVSARLEVPADAAAFGYRFRDSDSNSDRPAGQWARTVHFSSGGTPEIQIDPAPFVLGIAELTPVITHEVVHAVLARELGEVYGTIPRWLDEGIAVEVAGQTDDKLERAVAWTPGRDAASIIDGLATDHHWTDYAEDALAIAWLEEVGGPRALPRLVDRLRSGEPWPEALRAICGLSWEDFEAGARRAALARIAGLTRGRDQRFRQALDLMARGEDEPVIEALDPFVRLRGRPYRLAALLYRGQALLRVGRPAEAERDLALAISSGRLPPRRHLAALEASFRALTAIGREQAARARCRDLLDLAPHGPPARTCLEATGG